MKRTLLPSSSLICPKKLAHVVLWTNQLMQLRDWYCKVLGAHVVHENEKLAFLTYDEEHHRIAISSVFAPMNPRSEGRSVGMAHMAFTLGGIGDLVSKYAALKAEGIVPYWTINHGPTVSLYYSDPDRNNVELQVDVFEDALEAIAWMKGEAFSKNPLGIEFNIDELVIRYLDGESENSLLARGD